MVICYDIRRQVLIVFVYRAKGYLGHDFRGLTYYYIDMCEQINFLGTKRVRAKLTFYCED